MTKTIYVYICVFGLMMFLGGFWLGDATGRYRMNDYMWSQAINQGFAHYDEKTGKREWGPIIGIKIPENALK